MDTDKEMKKWTVVGLDRFEDEGDPFYRIGGEHKTEKMAERAARKHLSQPEKRFAGGQDEIYIVTPAGEKRRFRP